MADTRYLKLRHQTWAFQIKVPADVQAAIGKKVIVQSLKTRDLTKAQKDRWPLVVEWNARFDIARGKRQWMPAEIEEQARREYQNTLEIFQEVGETEENLDIFIGLEGDALEDNRNAKGEPLSDLEYAQTKARLVAASGRKAALNGQPFTPPETFGRNAIDLVALKPVIHLRRNKGRPFAETARQYIEEVQRDPNAKLKEQTRGQYEAVYRLFDSWADAPGMNEIDATRATAFLDAIAKLDPNWGRGPETKRLTFAQIAQKFGNHEIGLSNRTINRYATALSLVWDWSKKRGYVDRSVSNPWEDQSRPAGERRKTQKLPFTVADLKKLLATSPEVKPTEQNAASTLPWLCLVAAYSGMRLNEICSLKVADIKREHGVRYFDVSGAKTEAGDRRVPIHSRLIQAGLLKFAEAHGNEWLFPALKPGGPDGKRSWYISKRFTEFRRDLGVVKIDPATKKDRVDFHSFRRSIIQVLEIARLPQTEIAQVVGHEREGITFKIYNPDGLDMQTLRKVVEAIRYEGI